MGKWVPGGCFEVVDDSRYPSRYRVVESLVFSSDTHGTLIVPPGFVSDACSIPVWGLPLVGGFLAFRAGVLHDYLCQRWPLERRDEADDVFRQGLEASQVDPPVIDAMTAAVRAYSRHLMAGDPVPLDTRYIA